MTEAHGRPADQDEPSSRPGSSTPTTSSGLARRVVPGGSERPDDELLRRSLIDDSQLVFLAVRVDGTIVLANRALERVLGRDPATVVGVNALEWVHPDDVERALEHLSEAAMAAGLTPGPSHFRMQHRDGRYVSLEVLGNLVTVGGETFVGT